MMSPRLILVIKYFCTISVHNVNFDGAKTGLGIMRPIYPQQIQSQNGDEFNRMKNPNQLKIKKD